MNSGLDLTGKIFDRLTVLELSHRKESQNYYKCLCNCGKYKTVRAYQLTRGRTRSCGCLIAEAASKSFSKHKMSKTKVFRTWVRMRQRCEKPNSPNYKDYGARGITVCERWAKFENFYKDMGEPPDKTLSLHRKNNDLGYFPENCCWATSKTQGRARRSNHPITFNGQAKLMIEWAEEIGITHMTLWKRLNRGWSIQKALTQKNNTRGELIEFNGEFRNVKQWAQKLGLPYTCIKGRFRAGWSVEDALSTPIDIARSTRTI